MRRGGGGSPVPAFDGLAIHVVGSLRRPRSLRGPSMSLEVEEMAGLAVTIVSKERVRADAIPA